MAKFELDGFTVSDANVCTANGGFVGSVTQPAGTIIPAVAGTAITKTGSRTFLTVASANAAHWVTLPTPVVGDEIWLKNGATGYEIRSSAPATIAINGGTGASAESAVIANQLVRLICTSATTWIATNFHTDGTVSALEAAA